MGIRDNGILRKCMCVTLNLKVCIVFMWLSFELRVWFWFNASSLDLMLITKTRYSTVVILQYNWSYSLSSTVIQSLGSEFPIFCWKWKLKCYIKIKDNIILHQYSTLHGGYTLFVPVAHVLSAGQIQLHIVQFPSNNVPCSPHLQLIFPSHD